MMIQGRRFKTAVLCFVLLLSGSFTWNGMSPVLAAASDAASDAAVTDDASITTASNPVTISIADICRFRVADFREVRFDPSEMIVEATIVVLSNSKRGWRLAASTGFRGTIDWSLDGQAWQPLHDSSTVILSGVKSFWDKYHLYYRVREAAAGGMEEPQIQYQIYLEP